MRHKKLYPHAVVVGARIREIRKARGINLKQLAELTGLSYQYISNVERGEVNTGIETLVKIAGAFDMPVADLLRKDGEIFLTEGSLAGLTEAYHRLVTKYYEIMGEKERSSGLTYDACVYGLVH